MMNRVLTWQVIVLAALFSLGAKNEKAQPTPKPANTVSSAVSADASVEDLRKMQKEAGLIIENILAAMNEKNYKSYIRDFNASMKAAYTRDVFQKNVKLLQGKIGKYESRTLSKIERAKTRYIFYCNAKFSKAKGPVVVRLVLERTGQKLQVVFLSFDAPEIRDSGKTPRK
jgi:hypothetical protein